MMRLQQLSLALLALQLALLPIATSNMTTTTSGAGIVAKVHSRQKRYLAFPDGSSVSAAICLTVGMLGNPNVNFISWAVNWGVAYNLPNHNWVIQHAHGFAANLTKPMIQRRSRRSFYNELQTAIDHMGFNGRDCVARALCESAKYLQTPGRRGNMLEQLVRTVFSLPTAPVAAHEPASHHEYDSIYRRSKRELRDCHELYAGCQFSLLALGLGHYAAAPAQFNKHHFM